jgi:HTH-type transcriptional regulator/antitoxin HipB
LKENRKIFPVGNIRLDSGQHAAYIPEQEYFWAMRYTAKHIGDIVHQARKAMGVTQKDLALTSGTGLRFIIELEQGKPTCQLEKVLTVLNTLGVKMDFTVPYSPKRS